MWQKQKRAATEVAALPDPPLNYPLMCLVNGNFHDVVWREGYMGEINHIDLL